MLTLIMHDLVHGRADRSESCVALLKKRFPEDAFVVKLEKISRAQVKSGTKKDKDRGLVR